jgi:hypothetical protein
MHLLLTLATDGGEWSTSSPSHFTPGREPYVGPIASLAGFGNNRNLLPLPGYEAWAI